LDVIFHLKKYFLPSNIRQPHFALSWQKLVGEVCFASIIQHFPTKVKRKFAKKITKAIKDEAMAFVIVIIIGVSPPFGGIISKVC